MKRILIAIACFLYVVSPLDLLPEFLPIIGWLDDVAAIVLTIRHLSEGGRQKKLGAG
jgi:uncharacterized membrane protein YkvA (DUF1232 family)